MRYLSSCLLALALIAPVVAHADALTSGFTCSGTCGTMGADGVVSAPPNGASTYTYVSTAGSSSTAVIPTGAVGGETNGSTLTSASFHANAGASLNFWFNFVTSDGAGFSDYAWVALLNADDSLAALIFDARTAPSGSIIPGQGLSTPDATLPTVGIIDGATTWSALGGSSGQCYDSGCGSTGWVNATYNIATAATYQLKFGVTNVIDNSFDTGLAVSGISVDGQEVSPSAVTPEPSSLMLLGTGLLGVAGTIRRRIQQSRS